MWGVNDTAARRPPRVFLSYDQKEGRHIFNVIAVAMAERGFHLFDPANQKVPSPQELQQTVSESDVFLVILTPGYFLSKSCCAEARAALDANVLVVAVNDDDENPFVEGSNLFKLKDDGPQGTEAIREYVFSNVIVPVISTVDQIGVVRNFLTTLNARHVERLSRPSANHAPMKDPLAAAQQAGKPVPHGFPNPPVHAQAHAMAQARAMAMAHAQAAQAGGQASGSQEDMNEYTDDEQAGPATSGAALSAAVAAASATVQMESTKPAVFKHPQHEPVRRPQDYRQFPEDDSWLAQIPPPPPLMMPPNGWASVDDMIKSMIPVEALGLDRKRFNRWKRVHNVSFRGEDQKALTRIRRAELARLHARVARQQKRLKKNPELARPKQMASALPPKTSSPSEDGPL